MRGIVLTPDSVLILITNRYISLNNAMSFSIVFESTVYNSCVILYVHNIIVLYIITVEKRLYQQICDAYIYCFILL